MFLPRLRPILLAIAASGSLTACAYDDGYGYGGLSMGYGYSGYGDPYYDDYYGDGYGYGGGYGYPSYYGWYDGFYYPGIGIYVYDRRGRRHRWNDHQRGYWEHHRGSGGHHENWGGYQGGNHGNWNHSGNWGGRPRQGQMTPPPPPVAGQRPGVAQRPGVVQRQPAIRDRSGPWGGGERMRSNPRAPRTQAPPPMRQRHRD